MSFDAFMAANAAKPENIRYVVSGRFRDEEGKPVPWELRAVTGAEDLALRAACTRRVETRRGQQQSETDYPLYVTRLVTTSVVYPNLNSRELQDSYHVMDAAALVRTMLTAGEYAALAQKVQELCGFLLREEDLAEEAKN